MLTQSQLTTKLKEHKTFIDNRMGSLAFKIQEHKDNGNLEDANRCQGMYDSMNLTLDFLIDLLRSV